MDIVDILMAKSQSFSSETSKLIRQAKAAMNKANEVAAKADEIEAMLESVENMNGTASEIASNLETMQEDITSAAETIVENKILDITDNLDVITNINVENNNTATYKSKNLKATKSGVESTYLVSKNYTDKGNNEDGSMTQKAITEALNEAGSANLGSENYGKVVVIDQNGAISSGDVNENAIIDVLIRSGGYEATNAVGLEIDYVNKAFVRTQEAAGKTNGQDFNNYTMYGGRRRCIVDRTGQIIAWYGDNNYNEDGSIGQVMIYQPKFYYNRTFVNYETSNKGRIINKEILILSPTAQAGFKLHPLFIDENGEEIDYVLLSAYESTYFDVSTNTIVTNDSANVNFNEDYLLSIANVKPISGANKEFNVINAEKMANNIGNGWHITNMQAESANQMLFMVEFGQMNGQIAFEPGIVNISNTASINGASITGSTSNLGNATGAATDTINEINGTYNTYNNAGRRAISYRGFENPWGNIYRFIGGLNLYGDGTVGAGMPYITSDYNYTPLSNSSNYKSIGFQIANNSNWISAMGYGKPEFDWVYLPIDAQGTSLLPIGDFLWTNGTLNGMNGISIGGTQRMGDNCGLFYYACDQTNNKYSASQSARIMHIPTKNSTVYNANIASWTQQIGA